MLADALSAAILALRTLSPVLADACSATIFALAALPPVLADALSAAGMARVALPPMLADSLSAALFALALDPAVWLAPQHHATGRQRTRIALRARSFQSRSLVATRVRSSAQLFRYLSLLPSKNPRLSLLVTFSLLPSLSLIPIIPFFCSLKFTV